MIRYGFSLILFFTISHKTMAMDINFIREAYEQAVYSQEQAKNLLSYLSKQPQVAVVKGYEGATKMLLANHYRNPIDKLQIFNEGKRILESSIKKEGTSYELIFLRFPIQQQVPRLLGYNKNLKEDYTFLLSGVINNSIADQRLKNKIYQYLIENNLASHQDKLKLTAAWKK